MVSRRASLLWGFGAGWAAGCSPLQTLDRLTPDGDYRAERDIAYGEEERQRLDVYAPHGAAPARPVVLFLYGGSWRQGSRADYRFVAEWLTHAGFVAVIADYRLYPAARFPAFVEDGAAAFAWARAHAARYGGDPDRVFVAGHSAGGYIAALLALDPRYLAASGLAPSTIAGVVGISTPYEIEPQRIGWARPIFAGADPARTRPIDLVRGADLPRMLLLAGGVDTLVPVASARHMHAKLESAGAAATLRVYPTLGHIDIMLGLSSRFGGGLVVGDDIASFVAAPPAAAAG